MDIFKPFVGKTAKITYTDGKTTNCVINEDSNGGTFPYLVSVKVNDIYTLEAYYTPQGVAAKDEGVENIVKVERDDNYVLEQIAEVLVTWGDDDDSGDLVEEIRAIMRTNCQDIMTAAESKQDAEVEAVQAQIAQLDSAAYDKLLEKLDLRRR